jgi:type II secretory pathway component PulM
MEMSTTKKFRDTLNSLKDNLFRKYYDLGDRERTIFKVASSLFLVLIFYAAVISPVSTRSSKLENLNKKKREELKAVLALKSEYDWIRDQLIKTKLPAKDFQLHSHIANVAASLNIRIDSIKQGSGTTTSFYKENTVEVKLDNINLQQLSDFLYKLEKDPIVPTKLRRLHVKPTYKDPQYLEVSMLIVTFQAI